MLIMRQLELFGTSFRLPEMNGILIVSRLHVTWILAYELVAASRGRHRIHHLLL